MSDRSNQLYILFGTVGEDGAIILLLIYPVHLATTVLLVGSQFDVAEPTCKVFSSNNFLNFLCFVYLAFIKGGLLRFAEVLSA